MTFLCKVSESISMFVCVSVCGYEIRARNLSPWFFKCDCKWCLVSAKAFSFSLFLFYFFCFKWRENTAKIFVQMPRKSTWQAIKVCCFKIYVRHNRNGFSPCRINHGLYFVKIHLEKRNFGSFSYLFSLARKTLPENFF